MLETGDSARGSSRQIGVKLDMTFIRVLKKNICIAVKVIAEVFGKKKIKNVSSTLASCLTHSNG